MPVSLVWCVEYRLDIPAEQPLVSIANIDVNVIKV